MILSNPIPTAKLAYHNKDGNITQWYGESPELYFRAVKNYPRGMGHSGIDIAMPNGTPVHAAHDGIVKGITRVADSVTLGGNAIYLHSNDFLDEDNKTKMIITGYLHLSKILCELGQSVREGELIGNVGNTGFVVSSGTPYWDGTNTTLGNHTHFSVTLQEAIVGGYKLILNMFGRSVQDPCPWLGLGTRFEFLNDLYFGVKNYDTYALQSYLNEQGLFKHEPTGYFGGITQAAVMNFQWKNGITPFFGYVGPKTRRLLNSLM